MSKHEAVSLADFVRVFKKRNCGDIYVGAYVIAPFSSSCHYRVAEITGIQRNDSTVSISFLGHERFTEDSSVPIWSIIPFPSQLSLNSYDNTIQGNDDSNYCRVLKSVICFYDNVKNSTESRLDLADSKVDSSINSWLGLESIYWCDSDTEDEKSPKLHESVQFSKDLSFPVTDISPLNEGALENTNEKKLCSITDMTVTLFPWYIYLFWSSVFENAIEETMESCDTSRYLFLALFDDCRILLAFESYLKRRGMDSIWLGGPYDSDKASGYSISSQIISNKSFPRSWLLIFCDDLVDRTDADLCYLLNKQDTHRFEDWKCSRCLVTIFSTFQGKFSSCPIDKSDSRLFMFTDFMIPGIHNTLLDSENFQSPYCEIPRFLKLFFSLHHTFSLVNAMVSSDPFRLSSGIKLQWVNLGLINCESQNNMHTFSNEVLDIVGEIMLPVSSWQYQLYSAFLIRWKRYLETCDSNSYNFLDIQKYIQENIALGMIPEKWLHLPGEENHAPLGYENTNRTRTVEVFQAPIWTALRSALHDAYWSYHARRILVIWPFISQEDQFSSSIQSLRHALFPLSFITAHDTSYSSMWFHEGGIIFCDPNCCTTCYELGGLYVESDFIISCGVCSREWAYKVLNYYQLLVSQFIRRSNAFTTAKKSFKMIVLVSQMELLGPLVSHDDIKSFGSIRWLPMSDELRYSMMIPPIIEYILGEGVIPPYIHSIDFYLPEFLRKNDISLESAFILMTWRFLLFQRKLKFPQKKRNPVSINASSDSLFHKIVECNQTSKACSSEGNSMRLSTELLELAQYLLHLSLNPTLVSATEEQEFLVDWIILRNVDRLINSWFPTTI